MKEKPYPYQTKNDKIRKYNTLEGYPEVKGYDFEQKFDFDKFIEAYSSTGIQATNLGKGVQIVNQMVDDKSKIILCFTSNVISSGLREAVKFLVKHKYVDVLVTSAGGVEEDVIKCLRPFVLGSFEAPGRMLHESGVGRIGNIFAPFDRYLYFEKFMRPFFEKIYLLQKKLNRPLSTTEFTELLGKEINNEESYLYWAAKNNIPVYCPGLTDGSIGDLFYFLRQKHKDFYIDIVSDHEKLVNYCLNQEKVGALVLGGGISKHYALNANIFRDGLDYAVYITTAQEFDASDSGGNEEEAKTWAKIKCNAPSVKIKCEASIAFPLLVAATFGKRFSAARQSKKLKY